MEPNTLTMRAFRLAGLLGITALVGGCATLGFGDEQPGKEAAAATTALDAGDHDTALTHLRTLRTEYPDTPEGRQALLDEAYIHYQRGEPERAEERAATFLDEATEPSDVDRRYALQLRARAAQARWEANTGAPRDTGLARLAFTHHRAVVETYPESGAARDSLKAMGQLRRDLAEEELNRARTALDGGNPAEAAERAAWVAEQYRVPERAGAALALQVEALERMGRDSEAAATQRMLEVLYPGWRADGD